ncbi:MAG: rhomboid family intramembrane serine protease [Nitrospinota bacterium]
MIPLKDDNPTERFPVVTVTLIALNVLIFLYQLGLGQDQPHFVYQFGAIPSLVVAYPAALPVQLTTLTSMFLHGGILHVGGNMLYLWIFGNNIEDTLGRGRFLSYYLLCGLVAAWAHILVNPASQVPVIGASGAVSGVLGAYLILFPKARVLTLVTLGYFWRVVHLPAVVVLGFWIVVQLINGSLSIGVESGVAWFAHVGGFAAGLLLLPVFRAGHPRRRLRYRSRGELDDYF